jgi:hypothetical protein
VDVGKSLTPILGKNQVIIGFNLSAQKSPWEFTVISRMNSIKHMLISTMIMLICLDTIKLEIGVLLLG